MKLLGYFLFTTLILASCSTSSNVKKESVDLQSNANNNSLLKLASERFGTNYQISANKNWDYFLVTNFSKNQFELSTKFFVYDSSKSEIILEDFIRAGSVRWSDDYLIDVQIYPGNIQINNNKTDLGYIFDCKNKLKINK